MHPICYAEKLPSTESIIFPSTCMHVYSESCSNIKTTWYSAGVFIILRAFPKWLRRVATCCNNPTQVNRHQYTGISILCWNVYHVLMLQIFFSYPFHHIVDTTVRVQITGCKLHCSVFRHK